MSADLVVVAEEVSKHLQGIFKFSVVDKEDSTLMKAAAAGMDAVKFLGVNVPDSSVFMENYATTLGTLVALPKSIRDNPASKIEVVTHEAQHVLQFQESKVTFAWLYLTKATDRAQYESDAYAAGLAVRSWLTGVSPGDGELTWVVAALVRGYHLRAEDASYAETALKSHVASIRDGIYMTKAARTTIAFLEEKYPELKGTVH